ncbi:DUF6461 domain-containing protein [Gordonia sp. CPCC 205333]|uniref:DUF6461 domain-containing protein n=1 Tax=Gordonia sp. CPCC 205333 TaxID=3140790 RepID=UPI003AF3849D
MSAADQYSWLRSDFGKLIARGFCFTVVTVNPTVLIDKLQPLSEPAAANGIHDLFLLTEEIYRNDPPQGDVGLVVGVGSHSGSTLMFEVLGGQLARYHKLAKELSADEGSWVAATSTSESSYTVFLSTNGDNPTSFDTVSRDAEGPRLAEVTAALAAAEGSTDLGAAIRSPFESVFSAAGQLSGIPITPELMSSSELSVFRAS